METSSAFPDFLSNYWGFFKSIEVILLDVVMQSTALFAGQHGESRGWALDQASAVWKEGNTFLNYISGRTLLVTADGSFPTAGLQLPSTPRHHFLPFVCLELTHSYL